MEKELGIVICNYNKKEYVLKCIQSVTGQTYTNFDIFVVDNASNDGSTEAITQKYGDTVTLLANKENLGGSGGFNTGIRHVLEKGYHYLMLVDNDIIMDKENIANLMEFIKAHEDVGMVGSKIYRMDEPEIIQEFGADVDYEKYDVSQFFKREKDSPDLPEVQYCTVVPACSLITRTDLVKKTGAMPEENFIYWDDIEWGVRFQRAGYKTAAIGNAKVWHKGGANISTNTFQAYYSYRNKTLFFAKFCPAEKKEDWMRCTLDSVFRAVYACYYSGRVNRAKTIFEAFMDALYLKTGKADSFKIRPSDKAENHLETLVKNKTKISVLSDKDKETEESVIRQIKSRNPSCDIQIIHADDEIAKDSDLTFRICSHIFEIGRDEQSFPYIDSWGNVIRDFADYEKCRNYASVYDFFTKCVGEMLSETFDFLHQKNI